jgi:uncharacterized repeat protein (TIGR01451 family)
MEPHQGLIPSALLIASGRIGSRALPQRIDEASASDHPQSQQFESVAVACLRAGLGVRFQARGASMSPVICDGEMVHVEPASLESLRRGDIVLVKGDHGFRMHRLVVADASRDVFVTRGDCGLQDDPALCGEQILGVAAAKEVRIGRRIVRTKLQGVDETWLRCAARGKSAVSKFLRVAGLRRPSQTPSSRPMRSGARNVLGAVGLLLVLLAAPYLRGQVAFDTETNASADLTTAAPTLTFTHTSTGTNLLLLVSVSINITNAPTTTVTGVTYNGTALKSVGAHNDAGGTRRVEMWYLLAPATGAADPVVVTANVPASTVGVVAGAITFTGVDQTVPLSSFVSTDGTAVDCTGGTSGCGSLDVVSVVNGMVFDTMATDENQTVTAYPPQTQEWTATSGGNVNRDVRGAASIRTGAPSVPISETLGTTSNWSMGAVSINPSTADIAVATSVTAVALGQNSTYNITVTNNGPSAANNVTLTDTFADTNLSLVSYNASAGTSCTLTTTISCTLPTPLASGATATLTVVVSTTVAGYYPNQAVVADSNTPPDPNTGNNTYVALAPVLSVVCSNTTPPAGGTLTGVQNTYFPGTASVAAGATSIPVGTSTGAVGIIANGSLLLVIQMQDASINTTNGVAYGNGYTGTGFTTVNNAGSYEFVKATGPVAAGSVPIFGAGPGGGLVFAYTAVTASATKGASTYQVVLVPQYASATLGAATASAWNGSTGGILALDIAGQLNLNGATASVNGLGFRGGAGMQLTGGGGKNSDYQQPAPATYTGAAEAGWDAPKGEGIAGTPAWVESGATYLATNTSYPSGTAGTDGSMARGAPGNAGGGGTDGDPQTASPNGNDENSGGGGGANGGTGGFGGDSWDTNLSVGGEGGTAFPATIDRIAMGGGGGAGTRNNSTGNNQASGGAAGGGIIFIRAYSLTGTATLTANGAAAYNVTSNDAGGGGGAGGTIVILSDNGGEGGLTLQANGGTGANANSSVAYSLAERHGPGGGGAGGVLFVSGAPASISVSGGANGTTLNTPSVAYGATSGTAGTSSTNNTLSQVTGIQSSVVCTRPDLSITKNHGGGNLTRGTGATYTIQVSNVSPLGATAGTVTVNDTLPTGITPTGVSGTGWTCAVAAQTVSCTRSDSLPASSSYPAIAVTATVLQTAPATLVNTAVVSGGGDADPLNNTATDIANVVSVADLSVANVASPNPVAAGGNITYAQMVTNAGPSAADNATLVEAVPANTTFVSVATPAGWTCATPAVGGTGNVVCTSLSMAGSTAATFSMIVKVNTGTANGTVVTDTATVSSSVSDPNSANNTASASTVVGTTALAELSVTNVASPNPVVAGNNITYTQVVTNTGTIAAANATFSEATPTDTTLISITPPAGWTCTVPPVPVNCTDFSVAAGSIGTFTAVYTVTAGTASGTIISDTANVNAANQAFGANSATATDIVATAGQADLALTTAVTPTSVYSGNDITYTQTVTNNGPAAATTVSFTEAIPTNTTFVSVSAPAGWTCTTTTSVTCTDPSLAAGTSANIVIVVNVPSTVAAGTITANSSVSSATSDPNSANNSTTVTTTVIVVCDLAVTNSGTPSPVLVGGTITYTQVVTNSGPSNCSTATFTEAFPNNTTFVSLTPVPAGWTCTTTGPISCTNPSVARGSTSTFPVVVTVTGPVGTIITDTATVATTSHDTNLNNNSATVTIGVASATQADLSVTNSASPNPVTAGSNITYTQTVTNSGPAAATTVVLTETLPANTTFVSLAGSGWACTTVAPYTCTIATLAANTTATFTFVVTVSTTAASGSTITQTDSVSSATSDPNPGNNSASTSVLVGASADLSVTNKANPVPVTAGSTITYTQVITNAGPSTATTASLTEVTPPDTTFQSVSAAAGWSCITPAVGGTGTITCTNPSFAAGTASFTVIVTVTAGTPPGTAINDTATVSSAIADPNSANNSATAADVVALATQADLVTTNTAAPTSVAAGSTVTYTQSVTNIGPAVATGATFTQTTPPNTNFQSITVTGWTCTTPAVGAAGTITCTDSSNFALNTPASFTLMLQVNAGTASGTNIAETATATATNVVPSLTTNSATASVIVANANSADMAIVKTATPSPTVADGDTLTYSLAVTNDGPATATDVTVTDPLPSNVSYLSVTTTQGTCSEADGTVTCLVGTMASATTATVTIVTLAAVPGTASNTANVTADQTDPNLANNSSTQTETITAATKIGLQSFTAQRQKDKSGTDRVVLLWKTGGEADNLGFNVYTEQNGARTRLNPSLIAGSALLMRGALPKHSGKTYTWIDSSAAAGSGSYWLEDVDVNGSRTMHGPVSAEASASEPRMNEPATSTPIRTSTLMLGQLNQSIPGISGELSHPLESVARIANPTSAQQQTQFDLAAHPAVKIMITHEGWYSVAQPDLVKAGLNSNVDPALLHLYAEANEQAIEITGASAGPGGFGQQAAINFYGTGIDTPYSGTRVYWLVAGDTPGARIQQLPPSSGSNQPPASFPFTVEWKPRTTYFAALITQNGNNFFGPLVSETPLDQEMQAPHLNQTSTTPAKLEVVLQGILLGVPHDVAIALNGTTVGNLVFTGQKKGRLRVNLPPGVLLDGSNALTITAQGGPYDTSLVDYVLIQYPHSYMSDSDKLKFTGRAGDELKVAGFENAPVAVLDITNPDQPVALTTQVSSNQVSSDGNGKYTLEVQVPWTTTNGTPTIHTLLALAGDRVASPAGINANHPSDWHSARAGSEIVMVSHEDFAGALPPLIRVHQAEGKSSAVVPVTDLYDEFTFGEHSPYAIRDFLQTASTAWHTVPKYLLLNGRASLDPRDYLGFGHLDFVPTMIVPTPVMMTASDDWFSEFGSESNGTATPTIATGRLPVATAAEATTVIGKIAAYEGQSTNGPWTLQALLVADRNDTDNFTQDSQLIQAQLPSTLQVTDVFVSTIGGAASQDIVSAINSGQLLVNYIGHGSEDEWSGEDLFDNTTVATLTNGRELPVFLILNCLNGFFQDVYEQPLAVTLELASNGGAVAVLASSGLNQAPPQVTLDKLVVQNAFRAPQPALGDAILRAKSQLAYPVVRATYILFGDPAMPIKSPAASATAH